jgi:DNA-binding transcriptional LysR family regulator
MDLKSVRIFVMAAKYLNFSKVAETLFLSQSSISKYISSLENELGDKLLIRDTKNVVLTEFGQAFLPHAIAMLDQEEQALDFVHHYKSKGNSQTVRLGVGSALMSSPPNLLLFRVIHSINKFYERVPGIHIKMRFCPDQEIRSQVADRRLDMAIVMSNSSQIASQIGSGMGYSILERSDNYLLYPALAGSFSSLEELLPHIDTMIYSHDPVPQSITSELIQKCRIAPALYPCENWSELFISVLDGKGCGVIPEALLPLANECGIRHFSLKDLNISSTVCLIWDRERQDEPLLQMAEILTEQFTDAEK